MSRANCTPILGRDSIISALHWGPLPEADGFYKTSGQHQVRRTDYASAFHTFGVEWSEDYLFTYIDSRLLVCIDPRPHVCLHILTITASLFPQIQQVDVEPWSFQ